MERVYSKAESDETGSARVLEGREEVALGVELKRERALGQLPIGGRFHLISKGRRHCDFINDQSIANPSDPLGGGFRASQVAKG